jgi:hypothetical protein
MVEKQIKRPRALRNKMTQHAIFGHSCIHVRKTEVKMNDFSQTFHSIRFGESCSVVQNFYSFFVGTAHKGSRVIAVEAVSIDGQ